MKSYDKLHCKISINTIVVQRYDKLCGSQTPEKYIFHYLLIFTTLYPILTKYQTIFQRKSTKETTNYSDTGQIYEKEMLYLFCNPRIDFKFGHLDNRIWVCVKIWACNFGEPVSFGNWNKLANKLGIRHKKYLKKFERNWHLLLYIYVSRGCTAKFVKGSANPFV